MQKTFPKTDAVKVTTQLSRNNKYAQLRRALVVINGCVILATSLR